MKTIVISGAHSNSGKTTLGRAFRKILNNAVLVKIGTGTEKVECEERLYPMGTPFSVIEKEQKGCEYLIIESNKILKELEPDLAVYLPGNGEEKESANEAKEKADIVSGRKVVCSKAKSISSKLSITPLEFCALMDAADVRLCGCDFGVF